MEKAEAPGPRTNTVNLDTLLDEYYQNYSSGKKQRGEVDVADMEPSSEAMNN